MAKPDIDYLEFWLQAQEQEMGVYIETNNVPSFRNALYKAREESQILALTQIICFAPACGGVVMLVKQSVELEG